MNKYGYFKYTDVAFGAKEDALYSSKNELQNGSALTQLRVGVTPYNFASFEKGAYITRKPKRLYKNQQGLGFITKQISDENGYFAEPVVINAIFQNYHTASGITIHSKNIIYDLVINVYRDGEKIATGSYNAVNQKEFYPLVIESANRIEIIIEQIKEPLSFLGIFDIEYGTTRIFDGEYLQNAEITNYFSILGDTLEYDTLDLDIADIYAMNYLFQKKQPINYIFNDEVKARFFVSEGIELDEITTRLTCYDAVSNLEEEFLGGMYEGYSVKQLIDDIMKNKQINYEIDESLNNMLVNGYLPITSCRKALQSILLGTEIRCYKEDKLYFKPFNTTLEQLVLNETNILDKPQKNKRQDISVVRLKTHNYSRGTEIVEVYHWYISTTQNIKITFSQPLHSLKAYEVSGVDENGNDIVMGQPTNKVTFIEENANYCVVSNTSSNKIVIKGLKYTDSIVEYETKNPHTSMMGSYNEINLETTITLHPQLVCNLIYDLYSRKNSINFVTFEKLKIGGYYNILGENLNIKSIKTNLNGLYEVEAV